MPGIDAILSAAGALLLLGHFVVSRRRQLSKQKAVPESVPHPCTPEA